MAAFFTKLLFEQVGRTCWRKPTPPAASGRGDEPGSPRLVRLHRNMPSPNFAVRSEYRAPNRAAFNAVGTEGCRAPGNIPRQYGMLNAEIGKFGLNVTCAGLERVNLPSMPSRPPRVLAHRFVRSRFAVGRSHTLTVMFSHGKIASPCTAGKVQRKSRRSWLHRAHPATPPTTWAGSDTERTARSW